MLPQSFVVIVGIERPGLRREVVLSDNPIAPDNSQQTPGQLAQW